MMFVLLLRLTIAIYDWMNEGDSVRKTVYINEKWLASLAIATFKS